MLSFQRMVKFARVTTALSAALTAMSAAIVITLQVSNWLRSGIWDWYRLSSIIEQLNGRQSNAYVVASIRQREINSSVTRQALDSVLETPALVVLLFVLLLHLALGLYLAWLSADECE